MSEFHVEVVQLGSIEKHPNADRLGVTRIHGGYPVIVRLGEYAEGDLAVYVPVDAVVPKTDSRWDFLEGHTRIKAKKLRGVFSMGLLTKADPMWELGRDVAAELGIEKYEPPPDALPGAEDEVGPPNVPNYTDVEGLRRYPDVLASGEEIVITEKVHGENMRVFHDGERLFIGSRTNWKKAGGGAWWAAARSGDLERVANEIHGHCLYGEAFGSVGGFPYGTGRKPTFRAFDIFSMERGRYLDFDTFEDLANVLGIETAPVLYRGPWDPAIAYELAEGPSTLDASHVREGIVIRPVRERWDDRVGRVILKLHGQGFLLK